MSNFRASRVPCPDPSSIDVSVILVSYNTADLLEQCLASIIDEKVNIEIIVIDNASTDGSAQMVQSQFQHVILIANQDNRGFSKANNQGIQVSNGRYLLFLNPDTQVLPGALHVAVEFMDAQPAVGLAGTKIINPDNSPQPSVEYRYPGQQHAREDFGLATGDIAWVLGASIIARKNVIDQLGGFDEDYFLYAEETDLCLRARKNGWKIDYIPEAVIVHWGGQSEVTSKPAAMWRRRISSEIIFYQKHYSLESLRAISRANILQAYWRIFSLTWTIPFLRNKDKANAKLEKYRVVLAMFKEAIKTAQLNKAQTRPG